MKSVVHFWPDAETDVADSAAWYGTHRAGLGGEFLDEFLAACNNIAENSQMYPLVHRKLGEQLSLNFRSEFIIELKTVW